MKFNKSVLLLLFLSMSVLYSQVEHNILNLMPFPKSVEMLNGKFNINAKFSVQIVNSGDRIRNASNRFLDRLTKRTGLFLENPFVLGLNDSVKSKFIIDIDKMAEVKLGIDESYSIKIDSSKIFLKSATDIGAIRGLETLLQLLKSDSVGYFFPEVNIFDSPRFPWRGMLIDVCRHFMPIEVIKRNIDGMATVKMNVLHLHLSEDQGFRVESKVFPKLQELGSDGLFYTQQQIKDIIKYAGDRGIRVIPEFDVPGHATAILTAYPELGSAPGPYKIQRDWGVFDPTLNPINENTYIFLEKLFAEMSELFTDEYFHIGGDENNGKQWDENEDIQKFKKDNNIQDNHALQGYFNNKLLKILTKHHKKMVGWDEIFHESMPNNIVIQSWRGKDALFESAQKGYQAILSNGYYIDLNQSTDFHYLNDPIPLNTLLTEKEKKYILGGEATMWAEMVSPETIDSRIWPRTAAIAERLWSPQNINDVENMYSRLETISFQLEEHGLTHIKNREMMLRNLTNNQNTEALATLISIIEPVKNYRRNNLRKQTQQTPLSRVVDVATADAKTAREFRNLVDSFLTEPEPKDDKLNSIKNSLILWKNNHIDLDKIIKLSPILFEIKPLSENLNKLAKVGLEAIDFFMNKEKASEEWKQYVEKIIEESKKSFGQVEIVIIEPIQKLVGALNQF